MQWRGAEVEPDGTRPEPESWTPEDVPGRPAQFAGAEAVAYRTVLENPRSGRRDADSQRDGETEVAVGTNATASIVTIELPGEGTATLTLSTNDRTVQNSYPLAGRTL